MSTGRNRAITVRVSDAEAEAIKQRAQLAGRSVSGLVREALLDGPQQPRIADPSEDQPPDVARRAQRIAFEKGVSLTEGRKRAARELGVG